MDKLINYFLLYSFLLILGLSFSQGLCGQETVLAQESSLMVEDDIFGGTYEYTSGETIVSDGVISGGANVSYKAVNSIKLTKGFKVEKNCSFKAQLVEYSEVVEKSGAVPKSAEGVNTPARSFTVHPNVTNGIFHVGLKGNEGQATLDIYNTSGILVYSDRQLNPGETAIDLTGFPKGVYLLKSNIDNKPYQEKIVLR